MLSNSEIKTAFHQLIDEIEDTKYLRVLYDSIAELILQKDDTLEGLNSIEIEKLHQSMLQAKNGKTITDAIMRQNIAKKWHL